LKRAWARNIINETGSGLVINTRLWNAIP